jgi:predicted short-subunit dehydrogenase-like oxidoreductase (DUF2520 family)
LTGGGDFSLFIEIAKKYHGRNPEQLDTVEGIFSLKIHLSYDMIRGKRGAKPLSAFSRRTKRRAVRTLTAAFPQPAGRSAGDMKIDGFGFIGAGKVGTTLGKYFTERGHSVRGYFSSCGESAEAAARFTGSRAYESAERLAADSAVIFVTVPDKAIGDIWETLKSADIQGKCICHCSGALSSRVFDGISARGAAGLSVHPLAAINSRWDSHRYMHSVSFTVEGDAAAAADMKVFLRSMGNPAETIDADKKDAYHAGAVFLTNFVVALAHAGAALLRSCGPDREFVEGAARRLFFANAENICAHGAIEALTGPVERGDAETVRRHLECLEEPTRSLYALLSRELLQVAKAKNPERDYGEIEEELNR